MPSRSEQPISVFPKEALCSAKGLFGLLFCFHKQQDLIRAQLPTVTCGEIYHQVDISENVQYKTFLPLWSNIWARWVIVFLIQRREDYINSSSPKQYLSMKFYISLATLQLHCFANYFLWPHLRTASKEKKNKPGNSTDPPSPLCIIKPGSSAEPNHNQDHFSPQKSVLDKPVKTLSSSKQQ